MNIIEHKEVLESYTIEQLYDKYLNLGRTSNTDHGHELIKVHDLGVLSCDSNSIDTNHIEYSKVKNLIRHSVDKPMYKIKTSNGRSVTVTEDHGCVKDIDGKLIRVTPKDIIPGDRLLTTNGNEKLFTVVSDVSRVGYDCDYVYDIEMQDDPHLFFADDVIVHNSLYINAEPMVNKVIGDAEICDDNIDAICDELDGLCDLVNRVMTKLCKEDLHSNYPTIEYKRECFASEGIFTQKKRYALHVRDDEGKRVDKFKHTGNEIKKSEYTPEIKVFLKHIYEQSLVERWISSKFASEFRQVWDKFNELTVGEIAIFKRYGSEKTMEGFLAPSKGTGGHAKASLFYNHIIEDLGLVGSYNKIRIGDKVRVLNIHKTNKYGIDVIAWPAHGQYPKEFDDLFTVDKRVMFHKTVIKPLSIVIELNQWNFIDPCDEVEVDIMSL